MGLLNSIAGKIVAGVVALAVVGGAISWWQTDPATRSAIISGIGRIIAWLGIVLLLPWPSFPLIGHVARRDSNFAGAILIGAMTLIEMAILCWLFGWHVPDGPGAWTFVIVGGLFAAAYNLLACDFIAEKLET